MPFDFHPPRPLRSHGGTAQGGLSAFGSFPTRRENPRPSPAGSLVIAGKTGEGHLACSLRARHKHRGHQLSPAPTKQTVQAGEVMRCSGVIRAASTARKWRGCLVRRRSGKMHPWVCIPRVTQGQDGTVAEEGGLLSHQGCPSGLGRTYTDSLLDFTSGKIWL